jgi:hypothetical protein
MGNHWEKWLSLEQIAQSDDRQYRVHVDPYFGHVIVDCTKTTIDRQRKSSRTNRIWTMNTLQFRSIILEHGSWHQENKSRPRLSDYQVSLLRQRLVFICINFNVSSTMSWNWKGTESWSQFYNAQDQEHLLI